MRLLRTEAPVYNPVSGQLRITCAFCRVEYIFLQVEAAVYSHNCPDVSDRVYCLNGFALTGVAAYLASSKPGK